MSQCYRHLPGAAGERIHHLVDLASNGPVAAAAVVEEGIASAHLHTWHWHTRQEEEVLRVDTHHPGLSGGYKTSLSAEEPVVVHRIRKLA